jgi:hypothetical protein
MFLNKVKVWTQRKPAEMYTARSHTPIKPAIINLILDGFKHNPSTTDRAEQVFHHAVYFFCNRVSSFTLKVTWSILPSDFDS